MKNQKITKIYGCERCGDMYDSAEAVNSDASVFTGPDAQVYTHICEKCAIEIIRFMIAGEKENTSLKVKIYKKK